MTKIRTLHTITTPETHVVRSILRVLEDMLPDERFSSPEIAHRIYSGTGRAPSDTTIRATVNDLLDQGFPGLVRLKIKPSLWTFEKVAALPPRLVPEDPAEDEPVRVKIIRMEGKLDTVLAYLRTLDPIRVEPFMRAAEDRENLERSDAGRGGEG